MAEDYRQLLKRNSALSKYLGGGSKPKKSKREDKAQLKQGNFVVRDGDEEDFAPLKKRAKQSKY